MKKSIIVYAVLFMSISSVNSSRADDTLDSIAEGLDIVGEVLHDWIINGIKEKIYGPIIKPTYADFSTDIYDRAQAGGIDDPAMQQIDTEHWNELIKKYAPIIYLASDELYLPITAEEYCTGLHTSMVDGATNATVIPEGLVTMQEIYQLHQASPQCGEHYFQNERAVHFGSNPAIYKDKTNVLRTPVYVVAYETADALYIQYLLFFGFNGPYMVRESDRELFNAHEADLEHFTIELDKTTREPKRFYFSAHGRREGVWLDAHHADVSYEGTHPFVYIARSGHGTYPKAGVYIRIYGCANDHTDAGTRWEPLLKHMYTETDTRFNVTTMGWMYHSGHYGKEGVGSAYDQGWFMNSLGGDLGRAYDDVLYCPPANSFVQSWCIMTKMPYAEIPE